MEIDTIHYIVHPLFALDIQPAATRNLLDKLDVMAMGSGEELYILELGGYEHVYDDTVEGDRNKIIAEYHRLAWHLLDRYLECKHLFVGKPSVDGEITQPFREYLEETGISISEGCSIVLHGTYKDACIPERAEEFISGLDRLTGRRLEYIVAEETSL